LGWLSVSLLFPLAAARGQDALYNALSFDNATAAQANQFALQPDQPHLGPVQLALGVYANAGYDDNINQAQTGAQSDVILRGGANLGFTWPATDRSALQFGTGIGYVHYLKYKSNNGLEISPDSVLSYAVSVKDATFSAFDQFSVTRQVTTEAALANQATLPRFENSVGVRSEWDPDQWTFLASYSHNNEFSDQANDYLNSSSEYFFGRAGWYFAEATQAGLEASGGWTVYQVPGQGDNDNVSVGGYIDWRVRPSTHLVMRGGPTYYRFYSQGPTGANSSLSSYYVSLEASQQLTDFLSNQLSVDRSVNAGISRGSSYVEELAASESLSWVLTQHITVGPSLTYENGHQPFGVFPLLFTENYQRYGGGLSLGWKFTDHLSGNVSYSYWLRDSNLANRGYSENSVQAGLNYTF